MKLKDTLQNRSLIFFTSLLSLLNVHIEHFKVERLKDSTIKIVDLLYLPIFNSYLLDYLLKLLEEKILLGRKQIEH
jgi:hypothetical protein